MNPYQLNEEQDSIPVGQPITYPHNPYTPSNHHLQMPQRSPHQELVHGSLPQGSLNLPQNQYPVPVETMPFSAQQGLIAQNSIPGCPFCRSARPPVQLKVTGKVTVGWAVFLCLCCWPAMWAPFCVDGCLDTHLACPDCKNVVFRKEAKCCPS